MDDLKPLAVFAETVDAGSMSAAARRLGMSPSAVSQVIRALEQQSSVTLLHRSTRKLALTEAGERYYPHCKRLLEAARAAAQALQQARDAPTGELRVSAPVGFVNHVAPALAPLLSEAPQLRLRLLVDDAMIDLIEARVDVAIRVGRMPDSSWVARRLCDLKMILCASPGYLSRYGTPAAPPELMAHQWMSLGREASAGSTQDTFPAPSGTASAKGAIGVLSQAVQMPLDLLQAAEGRRERIVVESRIVSNNQVALQQMCEHSLGIARLAHADVLPSLQRGALVQVLPAWSFPTLPVWAVTPRRDGEEAKVRDALAHLKRYFAALPGASAGDLPQPM
ncbi:LysR family transcriptional regulator [Tahibacter amnicola]|uniref:LysR family transcriptional regulator n=1 Tax=Tahibacter amnicola TaxID=2976241 RepID=A0ABY6B7G4_9GAMM|nr:LysR family transcriptional regulator [Tahibacter amnicola]UXI66036.1 LysR family transcriptional regulator [Tahibacter amnicola]